MSVSYPAISPYLLYEDAAAAVDFLVKASASPSGQPGGGFKGPSPS